MAKSLVLLIETLEELAQVLASDEAISWSAWMRTASELLKDGDLSGADHLLRAYAGMGSINDVVLGQSIHNGALAWKPGHIALNERFELLRSRAWQLARDIQASRRGGT